MKKNIIVFLLFLCVCEKSIAQVSEQKIPITADSLTSGNYKDMFKSFFQLAANHFVGDNKELQFSTNPFALMARADTSLLRSKYYSQKNYTQLRNLNFSFAAKLDSSYRFNGFSSGIKYALINRRDETVSKAFVVMGLRADSAYTKVFNDGIPVIHGNSNPILLNLQWDGFFAGTVKFKQLDSSLQKVVRLHATPGSALDSLVKTGGDWTFRQIEKAMYDSLRSRFHERGLLTVGLSDTTYKDKFVFSNLVFSLEYLKGLNDPTKPIRSVGVEFDAKAQYNFLDDTLNKARDLNRQVLQIEPGFNLVFRNRKTLYSWLEFKVSGGYYHNFGTLYKEENRDIVTLNGTMRVRIFNDIWIPIDIKYDPKAGNVLGFVDIKFNFNGLKNMLASSK